MLPKFHHKYIVTYQYTVTFQREIIALSVEDAHYALHEMDTDERMDTQYEISMEMLDTVEVEEIV
jgi:hypothetical protein